jgi:hypothetical protein
VSSRTRRPTGKHTGPCRYCREDVLWLTNVTTGKVAPINHLPVPGGNVAVDRNADGTLVGTYTVLAGADRDAADSTTEDLDAQPTLRLMHRLTCEYLPPHMRPADRRPSVPAQGAVTVEDPPDLPDGFDV